MSLLEIDTNIQPRHPQVASPGWFVVHRPGVSLILFGVVLALIGFTGGVLMTPEYRAELKPLVGQILRIAGLISVPVLLMVASPKRLKWQVVLALLPLGLMFAWLVFLPEASGALVPAYLCLAATMPFLGRLVGRWLSWLFLIGPVLAVPPLVALAGWGLREDLLVRVPLSLLMAFGFATSMVITCAYGFRLLRRLGNGAGQMRACAHALNDTLREVMFGAWAAAGLAAFYVRDMLAYKGVAGLSFSAFLLILLCGGAALIGAAAFTSWVAHHQGAAKHLAETRAQADFVLRPLNKRFTPVMYLAALAITGIVTLTLLLETPKEALIGPEGGVWSFSKMLFLVLAGIAAGFSYRSLRIGVVLMVTFLLADFLAMAMLASQLQINPMNVTDTVPRLFVLLLLAGLVEGWRGRLDDRLGARLLVREALAEGLARYLAGLVLILTAFIAVGIVTYNPDISGNNGIAYYASLRFMLEALLALMIAPMVMMLVSHLRLTR